MSLCPATATSEDFYFHCFSHPLPSRRDGLDFYLKIRSDVGVNGVEFIMEQLIRDLNSPQNQSNPEVINVIQRQLQRLQRAQSGWQAGLDLLKSDDQILQFYGALTIGLKVNADWENDKIGENQLMVSQLMQVLITTYTTLSAQSSKSDVVVNKLATVLAAVFAKPDVAWAQPCSHVLACMLAGSYLSEDEAPDVQQMLSASTSISPTSLRALLRLGLALQEENAASAQGKIGHRYQIRLSNNAKDMWQLLQFAMTWACRAIRSIDWPNHPSSLEVQGQGDMQDKILDEICLQVPVSLHGREFGPLLTFLAMGKEHRT